jgi:hypothetical protein
MKPSTSIALVMRGLVRSGFWLCLIGVSFAGATAAFAPVASAATGNGAGSDVTWMSWMPGGRLESKQYVGLCAEIGGSSTVSGVSLSQWPCAGVNGSLGGNNQVWDFVAVDRFGQQILRNRASRNCVHESVTSVKQERCAFEGSNTLKQVWSLESTTGGYFRVRSVSSNTCLRSAPSAAHGATLTLGACTGAAAEWRSRNGTVEATYGYTHRKQTIRPLITPTAHFWSSQFTFVTQTTRPSSAFTGGYVGIQRDAQTNVGAMRRAAVFSIWGGSKIRNVRSGGATGSWDDDFGIVTGEGGYGVSCVVPYDWSDGSAYNVDLFFSGYDNGPTTPMTTDWVPGKWWSASINGSRICDVFVPGVDRRGSTIHLLSSRSQSFSEDFSAHPKACVSATNGNFRAQFDPPHVWSGPSAAIDSDPVFRPGTDPNCATMQDWIYESNAGSYGPVVFYRSPQGTATPGPSAPFDFPDFFAGGGALRGADTTFPLTASISGSSVPLKNSKMGVVRINAFIAAKESCASGLCFDGNNRDFDPWGEARANKVAIELNFITGQGHIYVSETCRPRGLPSCMAPRPLRRVVDPHDVRFKDQGYTNWYFFVVPDGRGNASIQIGFTGTNSFSNLLVRGCSINQNHVLYWNAATNKMQFNGSLLTDEYPSREIYWYPAAGNKQQPSYVTLAQVRESGSPVGTPGLCTFAP